jgi:predicted RNA binding protein YcfA (HicA-like mRNA interferase family)
MRNRKLLERLQQGNVANVDYEDFLRLIQACGFVRLRTAGSHVIFGRVGIKNRLVVQPFRGKAQPYQVRQFLALFRDYNLSLDPGGTP